MQLLSLSEHQRGSPHLFSGWPHGPASNRWYFYPTLFSVSCSFLCSSVTSCAWLSFSWLTALSWERRSSESVSSESSDWCSSATWPRQRSHDEWVSVVGHFSRYVSVNSHVCCPHKQLGHERASVENISSSLVCHLVTLPLSFSQQSRLVILRPLQFQRHATKLRLQRRHMNQLEENKGGRDETHGADYRLTTTAGVNRGQTFSLCKVSSFSISCFSWVHAVCCCSFSRSCFSATSCRRRTCDHGNRHSAWQPQVRPW